MMGEYLLYYNGLLFGGIYDDRLLVKMVDSNKKYNMQESIPYESAKPMYLVDDKSKNINIIFKYEDKYLEALDFIKQHKCDIMSSS